MLPKKNFEIDKLQRGVFLLPNLFTSLNLFCGFYSIIASIEGRFLSAAIAIIISTIFDTLDGRIARVTNTTSRFGEEYDSMSDLISFGIAPGLLIYLWALSPFGRIGWLASFLFTACGALRLARFNANHKNTDTLKNNFSDHFIGLPITAAAGMAATTVLFFSKLSLNVCSTKSNCYILLFMLYLLSFLMVSTVKYTNFKGHTLFKSMSFNILVTVLLIFIFIAAQPSIALFMFGLCYVLSGPFLYVLHGKTVQIVKSENSDKQLDGS